MSEINPEDYEEKLNHLEQRHKILTIWIVMVFVALLLISLESFAWWSRSRPENGSAAIVEMGFNATGLDTANGTNENQ